jgi:6-phosphogluconolactonase
VSSRPRFRHFASREAMTLAAAAEIARILDTAITRSGVAHLVLAGGSTPGPIYERLARNRRRWSSVHLYWGDERCVPGDDPGSNYGAAKKVLLDAIDIPPGNVHRIAGELAPEEAARRYEASLREVPGPDEADLPAFDCILLGMGADGHTASLFPGEASLEEVRRWTAVTAGEKASPPVPRVTLTLRVINAARHALFAVGGDDKLGVVHAIETAPDSTSYPAARVRPSSGAVWYVSET